MDLIDPAKTGLGRRQVPRWDLPEGWVISARPARPALVSEEGFIAVQGTRVPRENADKGRQYQLAGLLRCAIRGRRLESCWANSRAAYRCCHGYSSASTPDPPGRGTAPSNRRMPREGSNGGQGAERPERESVMPSSLSLIH